MWSPATAHDLNGEFVVDSTFAYWMDRRGTVSQCALSGCGSQPTVLVNSLGPGWALAVGGGFVYFAVARPSGCAVYQCSATGCPSGPNLMAADLGSVMGIAADFAHVYWTEGALVRRCASGGCGAEPETFASGFVMPTAITLSAQNVYWIDRGSTQSDGRIWAAAK